MNIPSAFKMFWQRVASLVKFYTNKKVFAEQTYVLLTGSGLFPLVAPYFLLKLTVNSY